MPLLDFSKNCDIATSSFRDNLLSYTLKDNKIIWENKDVEEYVIKQDLFTLDNTNDFWTPIFISDDNLVTNKLISHYGSITGDSDLASGRIGIENFITFNPKFKNWNVNNGLMVIDWILNRSRAPYNIKAGLMYWKRKREAITGKITFFPVYSKIKFNNIIYIKIDNETVRQISPNPVKQSFFRSDASLSFNYTNNDADVKIVDLKDPIFTLYGSDDVEIWIPDGDQLLYFTNTSEEKQNNIKGIASRSYISGSLYKYYNVFYNSITAGEKLAKITDSRSVHKLRQYKKLAHSLSTSPFNSEFFVSLLAKPSQTIKDSISTYLRSNIESINTDINKLRDILTTISKEYGIYEIQNDSNIVKNNDQLFAKLFNKYGAKLQLSGDGSVGYRPPLVYGDSVLIEEIGETLASKTLVGTVVSNNKKITVGNLSVETSIGPTISSILLKHKDETTNNIVLYDSVKPEVKELSNINILMEKNNNVDEYFQNDLNNAALPVVPIVQDYDPNNNVFYWGPRNIRNSINDWLQYCPKFRVVNIDLLTKHTNPRFPNQAQEIIDGDFVCVWTKVSGPKLKFVDLNKTQTNKSYNIAYSNEVIMVPSSTGKYVIKCVVSSPYGSYTKIKTIFIVDGREKVESEQFGPNGQPIMVTNTNFATYSEAGLDNLFGSLSINNDNRININSINLNQYRTENVPVLLNKDKLKIFIAGLDSSAIHRNGLYAPIRTNYYVERVTANSRPIEKLNTNYLFTFDDKAQQSISPKLKDSNLTIYYNTNNTIIKLDRVILKNIRNETKTCSQCYSLYQPKFKSFIGGNNRIPFFSRSNKSPEGFSLQKYLLDADNKYVEGEVKEYSFPIISSDIAPPVASYGGYGYQVLDQLTIKDLDSIKRPGRTITNNGYIANEPQILPPATGYKLDYKDDFVDMDESARNYKFCYQQQVMPSGHIEFDKGTFVPNSGWVIGDNRNLSSVLKFNPGARKSFSFSGPGILGIGNYTNNDTISSNTFSSSIELNINPSIRWETGGQFCPLPVPPEANARANRNKIASIRGTHNMRNQLTKELADQYIGGANNYDHGYRILNGGNPKRARNTLSQQSLLAQNDEFNINIDEDNNKFVYSFNVVGPNEKIGSLDDEAKEFIELYQVSGIEPDDSEEGSKVRKFIEEKNGLNIRNPRVNNLTIKDVEIQLNFLNYVNTKNLIVWLEVEFSESEKDNMKLIIPESFAVSPPPPRALPQIKAQNNFIDQFVSNDTYKAFTSPDRVVNQFFISDNISVNNNTTNEYLRALTNMNSQDSVGEKVILYLLNQETIQNKDYNFSLKFSDSANKHNVLYDQNLYSNGIVNPDQNIISNNDSVNPSKHTDLSNTFVNSNLSNLNKLNRLNINNNTFHKLADRKLFNGLGPTPAPGCNYLFLPYDSSTKFTLHISVLEEEDDMFPMDTITNNELYTNIASVENSISSANLFNNLCSWELILHTEDVKKPVTSQVNSLANYGGTDSLSLIEYGNNPKYPGYSFIANLQDSKFLLPLVNMNAPTMFFADYNACARRIEEKSGKGFVFAQPRFPTEAFVSLQAGMTAGAGFVAGAGLAGVGVGTNAIGNALDAFTTAITNYYAQLRLLRLLEEAQRNTFDIKYEDYPFGNSDKILLNISKDGVFWYKIEAAIFKLSNTPALPLKQYTIIKNDSKLFKFDFNTISNLSDIIDDIFIPYIVSKATPVNAEPDIVAQYSDIDNDIYHTFNLMNVDELVFANKLIHSENIFQYMHKPNQTLVIIDHTIPYYLISIGDSVKLDCEDKSAIIMSKALIYKDSKYQTVLVLNKATSDLSGCSALLLPEDVVAIFSDSSTIEHNQSSPVSLFGLVSDQPPNDTIPDLTFSTNSLGSYGNGSSVKDKNILTRKVQINHIDSIYNQLNNFNNDKYYYNELSLTLPSGDNASVMGPTSIPTGINISIKSKLESYPVYYDNTTNNIVDNSIYHIYDNAFNNSSAIDDTESIRSLLSNIESSIKDQKTYTKNHPYNMLYLKVKDSDTVNKLYRNTVGSVTIENNYTYNDNIERITSEQLKILKDRLEVLEKTSDASLDSLVGNSAGTARLLESDSISYIQQHYDNLPEDAADCSRRPPNITCHKHRTYSKLQQLYYEKSEILHLLSQQTIQNNDGDYILDPVKQKYHTDTGGIIPDRKAHININTDKSLTITYEKVSENYYWINIDPKQSISIAEEMRPRVLKSVKYICADTNPGLINGVPIIEHNNICPDDANVNKLENDTLYIKASPGETEYIFKDDFIAQQKEQWGDVIQTWDEQTITRRFRTHGEQNIRGIRNNAEFLVTVIETYDIALDTIESYRKNGYDAGLTENEIIELLLEENIIKNDFSGDVYGALSTGVDSPSGKPTRVYNIFNLDDINRLKVQFRKTPRSIRGIDAVGTVLRYGENNTYLLNQQPPLSPLDIQGVSRTESLINNFYQWKCLQKDPLAVPDSGSDLLDAKVPEFFQLLNEMVFRTFFGSVDEIENKNNQLRSLYDFEMIPYEYFIGKPPS